MSERLKPFDSEGLETVTVEYEVPAHVEEIARERRREYAETQPGPVPSIEAFALDHVEVVVKLGD